MENKMYVCPFMGVAGTTIEDCVTAIVEEIKSYVIGTPVLYKHRWGNKLMVGIPCLTSARNKITISRYTIVEHEIPAGVIKYIDRR